MPNSTPCPDRRSMEKHDLDLTVSLKAHVEHRLDSLREYVDLRVDSAKSCINAQFAAMDTARQLAAANLDIRVAQLNELREMVSMREGAFITRDIHDTMLSRLDKELADLRESRAELRGKANHSSVIVSYVLAILGLLVSLFALLHNMQGP